ncbi:hypothetical protein [Micromonospora sp. NPDC092111]|uniref:YegP family protein n=1 Tax=Micromonospora sp. NPDC092111 TaxID=3364289 RepID=UPI00380A11F4
MQFQILRAQGAQPYFWRVIADNNRELAKSETLHNKADAISAAQKLKTSALSLRFEVFLSNSGSQPWSWRVWSTNNRILVAASETYTNYTGAQHAADVVKWGAGSAQIVDLTTAGSHI